MIVIVSEDYPGYGGYGTYAYNLYRILKHKYASASLIYWLDSESNRIQLDPLKLGQVYGTLQGSEPDFNVKLSNQIVLSLTPKTLLWVHKYLNPKLHFYRPGVIPSMVIQSLDNLWNMTKSNLSGGLGSDYVLLKQNPKITIIPNSPLMELTVRTLAHKHKLKNKILPNLIGLSYNSKNIKSLPKKYDLMFVTSDVNRWEKNFKIITEIYEQFPTLKKIIIGHNASQHPWVLSHNRENLRIHDFLKNTQVRNLMRQSKILLLPSRIDAGPSVIIEAVLSQCYPIMSLNTGFSSLFPLTYVCQSNQLSEWQSKIHLAITLMEISPSSNLSICNKIMDKIKKDRKKFQKLIGSKN